jgi:dTDP-4-dehydrorhamnose 3,5-epimerase
LEFSFTPQAIGDVLLVEHQCFADERGSFAETYRSEPFAAHGIGPLVQDNQSHSIRGVLRGLHYQMEPRAIGKLVRCIRGRIFDVAVDIRETSPTFRKWVGVELDGEDKRMLWVPPGFAHGFVTLSEVADVLYRQTDYYSPEHERAVIWNDPSIGVAWPITDPILSPKDAAAPPL